MTEQESYARWVRKGIEAGWVEGACATHDGIPSTEAEELAFWGDETHEPWDPCQPILRVWGPGGKAGQPDDLTL